METQTTKSIFKSKTFIMFAIALLAIATISAAAIYYSTVNVDITVDEALSVVSEDIILNPAYPGETVNSTIFITNDASVPLYTTLTWLETSNEPANETQDDVSYGYNDMGVVTLAPGANYLFPSWTLDEDSTIGDVAGTITLERVAEPVE